MKKECFFLVAAIGCMYTGFAAGASSPDANTVVMSPSTVVTPLPNQTDTQQDIVREMLESYDKSIDSHEWAITSVLSCMGLSVTFVVGGVGYLVWKNQKEVQRYEQEAKQSSRKARQWERLAFRQYTRHKRQAEERLSQIEQAAAKQRYVNDLWNAAHREYSSHDYEAATDLWKEIIKEKPENASAYNNCGDCFLQWARQGGTNSANRLRDAEWYLQKADDWYLKKPDTKHLSAYKISCNLGVVYSEMAKRRKGERIALLKRACQQFEQALNRKSDYYQGLIHWAEALSRLGALLTGQDSENCFEDALKKCEKAVELQPDSPKAYNRWATVLINRANREEEPLRTKLLFEAEEKLKVADGYKTGSAAYNFACLYALRGDEKECERWLHIGERKGTLATYDEAINDADLESMRDKKWFKEIRWRDDAN